jgi:uncharacterized membrane protein YfcA
MQIFLPIAEVSVNAFMLLGIGGFVGFLSGMFGVGGGFLITPLLMLIGVPSGVAVATGANQVVASSISGVLAQFKRRAVDIKMGSILTVGGLAGSTVGGLVFDMMSRMGQTDVFVQLSYVLFLGLVGGMMLNESLRALRRTGAVKVKRGRVHAIVHDLPFKVKFRSSGLYISVIPPVLAGFAVGFLSAIMGVGGGFIMVPLMIYVLGMPTKVVVGTSLFQITFVTAYTTLVHAVTHHTVDMMLALLLILGGVIGAQLGTKVGIKLKAEQLRILLSLMVLAVAIKIGFDLVLTPSELFSVTAP